MKRNWMRYMSYVSVFLLSVVAAAAAIRHWFADGSFMFFWDSYVPLDISRSFQYLYYAWHDHLYPGFSGAGWSWLPYWAVLSGLRLLFGGSLSMAQQALYLLLLSGSMFFFFVLIRRIVREVSGVHAESFAVWAGLAGVALAYTYNLFTFFYGYFMFNPDTFIFCFLPLNIYALLRLFPLGNSDDEKHPVIWTAVFFISEFLMTPGFSVYVFLAQYFIWLAAYLLLHWFLKRKKKGDMYALPLLAFMGLSVLLQWWWLYPSLLGFKALYASQSVLGTTLWFEKGFIPSRLLNSMRLIGIPLMMNNIFSWSAWFIKNPWFTLPLFIIPFLVLYAAMRYREFAGKYTVLFLFTVYLVSLFIVKFSNPPLSDITKFAFEHIPFFGAFRDSYQKAGLYYMFVMWILVAVGLSALTRRLEMGRRIISATFLLMLSVVSLVITTAPFYLFAKDNVRSISYDYGGTRYLIQGKTKIPPEYTALKKALEPVCKGTTIATVPRSGWISSAIWPTHGTSYIGQDFLAQTVECSFLTTVVTGTYAEANIEAPYVMLMRGDMAGFKQYLAQNHIGIILVRNDYVPYFPTSWLYTDPKVVKAELEKDTDFSAIYHNTYADVFRFAPLDADRAYGFATTSDIVFTNSPLATGGQYGTLSHQMGAVQNFVVLNTDEQLKKQKDRITAYAPVINCVGCVDVNLTAYEKNVQDPPLTHIKSVIKQLIGWKSNRPPAEAISVGLVDMHRVFLQLMNSLGDDVQDNTDSLLSRYMRGLEAVQKDLFAFDGQFFDVNQKMLETEIYLTGEERKLSDALTATARNPAFRKNSVMSDETTRVRLYYLSSLLGQFKARVESRIFKTDFSQNVYAGRLDIPVSGTYQCDATTGVRGVDITSLSIGAPGQESTVSALSLNRHFDAGSYPVKMRYANSWKLVPPTPYGREGRSVRISLGKMENGFYHVRFSFPSALSGLYAAMIVRGTLDPRYLTPVLSTDDTNSRVILSDTPLGDLGGGPATYDHEFQINSLYPDTYFLYFVPLRASGISYVNSVYDIANVEVYKSVKEGDIQMSCSLHTRANSGTHDVLEVTRVSPTEYTIRMPSGYTGSHLLFTQAYSPQWKAYATVNGKQHLLPHAANVYDNVWTLDAKGITHVRVIYDVQPSIERNIMVTAVLGVLAGALYIALRKRYG